MISWSLVQLDEVDSTQKVANRLGSSGSQKHVANMDGTLVEFEVLEATGSSISLRIGGEKVTLRRTFTGLRPGKAEERPRQEMGGSLVAPMPGRVVSVMARAGQRVKRDEPLVVLESMKMESVLRSDRDGEVAEVAVNEGDPVKRGQLLLSYRD
ncbi:MAG: biotin/lipoyl-binding protein [Nitrososphaerales archaeon]|nr:biotin/lipoyl-binding protein [Nitrososphaerales archaeon]